MAASRACHQTSQLTEPQLPKVPPSAPPIPAGLPVPIPNYTRVAPHPQGMSRWLTVHVVTREDPCPSQLSRCDLTLPTLKTLKGTASAVRDPQTRANVCAHVPPGHTELSSWRMSPQCHATLYHLTQVSLLMPRILKVPPSPPPVLPSPSQSQLLQLVPI